MKQTIITIITVAFFFASFAHAIEDTKENRTREAKRYIKTISLEEFFRDATKHTVMNLPVEQRESFTKMMTDNLDFEVLANAMEEAMIKHFTADELAALADFYGSKEGKSSMKKFGVYMAEMMPIIEGEMMKAYEKTHREME